MLLCCIYNTITEKIFFLLMEKKYIRKKKFCYNFNDELIA